MIRRSVPLVVAVMLVAVGCDTSGTPGSRPATNATAVPGLPDTVDALPTSGLAEFDALMTNLRGTPVVVNYWASWCGPCEREAPILTDAHARYGDRVQFLGIDVMDARDGAQRFIDEHAIAYPSLFDPANAIGVREGAFAPPMTFVVGADGERVATLPGELSRRELEDAIAQTVA